jgi:hypothetical protein
MLLLISDLLVSVEDLRLVLSLRINSNLHAL